jgi:hypothetical protein
VKASVEHVVDNIAPTAHHAKYCMAHPVRVMNFEAAANGEFYKLLSLSAHSRGSRSALKLLLALGCPFNLDILGSTSSRESHRLRGIIKLSEGLGVPPSSG